ncbi:MAG: DNA polymerase IV, partial [Verrucomicrobiota bacterium]|nr:DNA polymerase IV [Verrucomicrobiota bacterium]
DMVEPLSLDEAYLDVSHLKYPGSEIAKEIRAAIKSETELTASAGIGPNKLIAKIASDWNKPNGQCVVAPSKVDLFMSGLSVRRIWGVGPKSSIRLAKHGIKTCAQLQTRDKTWLAQEFGSFGLELYDLCRGIDERPVEANRIRKSLSNEQTFTTNLETLEDCREALNRQHRELVEDLRKNAPDRKIAKLLVKLKFSDFRRTTAEMSGTQPELTSFHKLLKDAWGRSGEPIRLLGIGVRFKESEGGSEQLELGLKYVIPDI